MSNFIHYFWLILLALYILSPLDAHPLFLDDLIATGVLLYLIYRNSLRKKQEQRYNSYSYNQSENHTSIPDETGESLTLDKAYQLLGVSPDAPLEEVRKAYKERISGVHPDKVNHLDSELQKKAAEVTLKINSAMNMIRNSRGD